MSDHSRITASHRSRAAVIYVRQSTLAQVERNRESTARQYDLTERAAMLGWPRSAVRVVDADLGGQLSEPRAASGAGPACPQILVDHADRAARPAQLGGSGDQVVLAGGGLPVALHLEEGGLADIHHRGPPQLRGGDLEVTHHRPPRSPPRWLRLRSVGPAS